MKLKNIGRDAVSLYRPEGEAGALTVEPGQTAEVPGELVEDQCVPDAILIDHDGDLRAYATCVWQVVGKPKTVKPSADAPKSEG
ncbi:MAG: hypothetical protein ACRDRX_04430 [Pseudonocardiaceae bacterium]